MQKMLSLAFVVLFGSTNLLSQYATPPSEPFELFGQSARSSLFFEQVGLAVAPSPETPATPRHELEPKDTLVTSPQLQKRIDLSLIFNEYQQPIVVIDYSNQKELFLAENIDGNLWTIHQEVLLAQERRCLVVLLLSNTDLYRIPEMFFKGLFNIVWLDLSHNHFIGLPPLSEYLPNLQILDLSYNCFSHAIFDIFAFCEILHTLNLSHNQIDIIFHQTRLPRSLQHLDVSYNQEDSGSKTLYLPKKLAKSPINIYAKGNRIEFF